jgi:hypothetical protein
MQRIACLVSLLVLCQWGFGGPVIPMPDDVNPDKVLNVRKHGAKGDGRTDDTAALNAMHPSTRAGGNIHDNGIYYFPAGTYLVSDSVLLGLKRCIVKGDGPDKTVLLLKANSVGFGDREKPKPVLSYHGNELFGSGMGQAFDNSLIDITVAIEPGNPGAVGVNYICNNHGTISNVRIESRDPDRRGAWGLGLTRNWPGPGLVRDMEVIGFDIGINSTVQQYSMTFQDIRLQNQREIGLRNTAQMCWFENLQIDGAPVGIEHTGGQLAIFGGRVQSVKGRTGLILGAPSYLRDVTVTGYSKPTERRTYSGYGRSRKLISQSDSATARYDDSLSGEAAGFGLEKGLVHLPVQRAPLPELPPVAQWVNADSFAESGKDFDYSIALQKAIDSGARVVYMTRGGSPRSTVEVRGNVQWIIGVGVNLWWNGPKDDGQGNPLFRVVDGASPVVVFEQVKVNQYAKLGWFIDHASARTVVLRHGHGHYRNTVRGGTVFLEDWPGPGGEFDGQTVFARQCNPEGGASPLMRFTGGSKAWILGLKTEYGKVAVRAEQGSQVEVIGAYHYHKGEDLYQVVESDFSVVLHALYPGYSTLLRFTEGGQTRTLNKAQGPAVIGRRQTSGSGTTGRATSIPGKSSGLERP